MRSRQGYALIVSVLIVSVILALLATAAAQGLFSYQNDGILLKSHADARLLAEGCAEVALLKLRQSSSYVGGESVNIGNATCTIHAIVGSTPKTIQTEATVAGLPYRLQIQVDDSSGFEIESWRRVTTF